MLDSRGWSIFHEKSDESTNKSFESLWPKVPEGDRILRENLNGRRGALLRYNYRNRFALVVHVQICGFSFVQPVIRLTSE